jgi:hypothetical protein
MDLSDTIGFYPTMIIAGLFALIGVFILFFGYIGLIRKTMTDGITLGLENGKSHSNSKSISPMNFRETISAGADLFIVIIAIILIPTLIFFMGDMVGSLFTEEVCTEATWFNDASCKEVQTDLGFAIQYIFQVSAVVLLLSGLLGISVKMVGDSIAHAVTKTGYGALVPQKIKADQVIFVDDIAPKFTKVEIVTDYEAPTVPPLPETGLPEGWTQEQWNHFGQQYLDGTL